MNFGRGPGANAVAAIVFDFDGVIANTERLHLEAFREVFAPRGWSIADEIYFDRYLGCDDHGLVVAYAGDHQLSLTQAEILALVAAKTHAFARNLSPAVLFPGAAEAIRALARHYPIGIASGALRHEISEILRSAGLLELFAVVIGAEEVTSCKPSPEPYLTAASGLNVSPHACVAIEDSLAGLESAHAAGMRTIGLTTTLPGHVMTRADRVVPSLADVTPDLIADLGAAN